MAAASPNSKKERNQNLSHITKPFDFQSYFSNIASPSSTEKIKYNNSRARTHFIIGSAYKVCPRPKRSGSMLTTTASSKCSTCFICSQEFPLSELTAHEKKCLESIKTNDVLYTRQINDDSSTASFPFAYASNLSTHTSSSGENGTEKKYSRCYICGTDVPAYLSSIHEKNCKKSWETGLLNSICTPARKSASRGDLSKQNSTSTPNLRKSQSSTTLQETSNKTSNEEKDKLDSKPKRLINPSSRNNSRGNSRSNSPTRSSSLGRNPQQMKSKSTTNLSSPKTLSTNSTSNLYSATTKSSEELRKSTEKLKKTDNNPQYMICQTCGKLYSVHSISIHQRQCERTYSKQKQAGTNVEYKVKSKSLADLTKSPRRPQTALSLRPTTPKQTKTTPRPASANPINRKPAGSSLSSSAGNLTSTPTYKRQLLNVLKDTSGGGDKSATTPNNNKSLTGLQKCYLCKQLYGTRSLPIHEKQCLKKWERNQVEEKKRPKKKPVHKDIPILAFGRSTFDDETNESSSTPVSQRQTPSQIFGIPSPLEKQQAKNYSKTLGDEISKELSLDDENLNDLPVAHDSKVINHTPKSRSNHTPQSGFAKSKFVVCIYCYEQYGLHSIAIHEKNCRQRKTVEVECKERIANNKNKMANIPLSKSVGNISSSSTTTNGNGLNLVKCDECQRKFLTSDIETHRRFCRVSVV